jgi:hypothetical protein
MSLESRGSLKHPGTRLGFTAELGAPGGTEGTVTVAVLARYELAIGTDGDAFTWVASMTHTRELE